jgi:hypothetical protein
MFARLCVAASQANSRIVPVPIPALRLLSAAARALPLPLFPDQLARLRAPKPVGSPAAREDLDFGPRPLVDSLHAAIAG